MYLLYARYYSKHFSNIDSFNLHKTMWGKYYYEPRLTDNETEAMMISNKPWVYVLNHYTALIFGVSGTAMLYFKEYIKLWG